VDPAFAGTGSVLFTPVQGSALSDLVMLKATGKATPVRDDAEENPDAFYRAAATANVEGALAVMTWDEVQQVVESGQQGIQLVSVDAGSGCVAPSAESIADGSYPLTQALTLVVRQNALQNNVVQSLLWYIFSDANYGLIENAGLIGVAFGDLPAVREALQTAFNNAAAAAAAAEAFTAPVTTSVAPDSAATQDPSVTEDPLATEDVSATDEAVVTEEAGTEEPAATVEVLATEDTATEEPAATPEATPTA
jgi:hypothetical protein